MPTHMEAVEAAKRLEREILQPLAGITAIIEYAAEILPRLDGAPHALEEIEGKINAAQTRLNDLTGRERATAERVAEAERSADQAERIAERRKDDAERAVSARQDRLEYDFAQRQAELDGQYAERVAAINAEIGALESRKAALAAEIEAEKQRASARIANI